MQETNNKIVPCFLSPSLAAVVCLYECTTKRSTVFRISCCLQNAHEQFAHMSCKCDDVNATHNSQCLMC